jgi:hypothetical protein
MLIHHPLGHCLGEEEERLVDVMVLMKILARVLEERCRKEISGGVDEVVKRCSGGKLPGETVHLRAIVEVHGFGGDPG